MARDELLYPLRTALHEARTTGEPALRHDIQIKFNGHPAYITIEVIPLTSTGARHYLVLFKEQLAETEPAPAAKKKTERTAEPEKKPKSVSVEKYLRLQEELAASREYLQSTIQDMEAANEELQSANEEILSSNEELQSTNEELDTAKEELQSTNEELNTVNEELHGRNDELSRLNSDLVNLLGSVQIAIVMVACDLRIRRFTPMAERVLNLIPTDIGRPISHIKPNIECPDLEQLITHVIETVTTQERMVRDRQGNWFSLRIRPYKNLENRIDGAVLALFDVEEDRRNEGGAPRPREVAEKILNELGTAVVVVDTSLRVKKINHAFEQLLETSETAAVGELLYELGEGLLNHEELRTRLGELDARSGASEHLDVNCQSSTLGDLKLAIDAHIIELFAGTHLILLEIRQTT